MAKENEFLKNNQAAQFVKDSQDSMKRTLSSVFGNTTKSFMANTEIQLEQSKSLLNIDKSLNSISKLLSEQAKMLSKNSNDMMKMSQSTRDMISKSPRTNPYQNPVQNFIRREDPDEPMRKNIQDIEDILNEMNENDKKQRAKAQDGFLGMFGKILGAGGLIGYLLTGKDELLFSVVKGARHLLKQALKPALNMIKGSLTPALKGIKHVFNFVKSVGKEFVSGGLKNLFSAGGKALAKLGTFGKSALKKIPGVGAILGVIFGVSRFKKGDWLGGLAEIGSGVASIFPGVGTAISVAIDSFLLFRDLSGVEVTTNDQKFQTIENVAKSVLSSEKIKQIPGVGAIVSVMDGVKKWQSGDKISGVKDIAMGIALANPLISVPLFSVTSIFDWFSGKETAIESVSKAISTGMAMPTTPPDSGGDVIARTTKGSEVFGFLPSIFGPRAKTSGGMKTPREKDRGFNPSSGAKTGRQRRYKGIKLFEKWNPNLQGLHPDMLSNFARMAAMYYDETGDTIQVNSAKRDGNGRSVHDHGWAIDIQSTDANALERMGYLKRFGFHRPLLNWGDLPGGIDEPWHIEPYPGEEVYGPRNTINNSYRVGTLIDGDDSVMTPVQGDGGYNVPMTSLDGKAKGKQDVMPVMLSDSDLRQLADYFGEQMKRHNRTKGNGPITNTQTGNVRSL